MCRAVTLRPGRNYGSATQGSLLPLFQVARLDVVRRDAPRHGGPRKNFGPGRLY